MLTWLKERITRRGRGERVVFNTEDPSLVRHLITLSVTREDCLTRAQLSALRHHGVGVRHWWLRHRRYGFAALDLPRGDKPFSRKLLLPPGHYTLGVGRAQNARRIQFEVTPDGVLRGL